jgi:predicted nucleic acid-binding protein
MPVVVDANIAIKWIVSEDLEAEARALLVHEEQFEAPDFFLAEIANVVWLKRRRGEIGPYEAEAGLRFIRRQIATLHSSDSLYERAFSLALRLDHPAYDCFYLACAEASGSALITVDRPLCDVADRAGLGHLVCHLADWPSP